MLFTALLAVLAAAYRWTRMSHKLLFWAAFVVTRPLGSVVGASSNPLGSPAHDAPGTCGQGMLVRLAGLVDDRGGHPDLVALYGALPDCPVAVEGGAGVVGDGDGPYADQGVGLRVEEDFLA